MVSEPDSESSSTPKLSLFSLPSPSPEPSGMLTPPLWTQASVPFQWEEEPGKPRVCTSLTEASSNSRCLELPPRLLSDMKGANLQSPSMVLEVPYVGRSFSYLSSFRGRERRRSSVGSLDLEPRQLGAMVDGSSGEHKERGGWLLGSWRKKTIRGSFKLNGGLDDDDDDETDSLVLSSYVFAGAVNAEDNGGQDVTKVKNIAKIKRKGSFLGLSRTTKSHFWASLYESFKHVVPWRKSRKWKKG